MPDDRVVGNDRRAAENAIEVLSTLERLPAEQIAVEPLHAEPDRPPLVAASGDEAAAAERQRRLFQALEGLEKSLGRIGADRGGGNHELLQQQGGDVRIGEGAGVDGVGQEAQQVPQRVMKMIVVEQRWLDVQHRAEQPVPFPRQAEVADGRAGGGVAVDDPGEGLVLRLGADDLPQGEAPVLADRQGLGERPLQQGPPQRQQIIVLPGELVVDAGEIVIGREGEIRRVGGVEGGVAEAGPHRKGWPLVSDEKLEMLGHGRTSFRFRGEGPGLRLHVAGKGRHAGPRRPAALVKLRRLQGLGDRHMHVEVAIGSETADKGDASGGAGPIHVFVEDGLLLGQQDRIVGGVPLFADPAVFPEDDRLFVRFPGGEVLVLGNAGPGHALVAVVDHRVALVVAVMNLRLEVESAVVEAAEAPAEPRVQGAAMENMAVVSGLGRREARGQPDGYIRVLEHLPDDVGIAMPGHALEGTGIIVIVVIEAHRKSFEDACRKPRGMQSPLLDGVAFEKSLVEVFADEAERLFLEGGGMFDRGVADRPDEALRLRRRQQLAEELIDRHQVDRQRIDAPPGDRLNPVGEAHELVERPHIVPDPLVAGVEDVRTVDVHHDVRRRVALGMTVAGQMRTAVEDFDFMAAFGQLMGDDRSREARPDDPDPHPHLFPRPLDPK